MKRLAIAIGILAVIGAVSAKEAAFPSASKLAVRDNRTGGFLRPTPMKGPGTYSSCTRRYVSPSCSEGNPEDQCDGSCNPDPLYCDAGYVSFTAFPFCCQPTCEPLACVLEVNTYQGACWR